MNYARKDLVFLIDTENTALPWVDMLPKLTKNCLVVAMCNPNFKCGTAQIKRIIECKAAVELLDTVVGSNAMDFQLVSYMGYLIQQNPSAEYVIVSRDRGYECLVSFWGVRNVNVERMNMDEVYTKMKNEPEWVGRQVKKRKGSSISSKTSAKIDESITRVINMRHIGFEDDSEESTKDTNDDFSFEDDEVYLDIRAENLG